MCVYFFLKDHPSHKFLPRFSLEHGMDQQAQGRSKSFATTTWLMVESCQSKGAFEWAVLHVFMHAYMSFLSEMHKSLYLRYSWYAYDMLMICLYLYKRNLASPHLNGRSILTTKSGGRQCLHVKTLKTSMMAFFSFVLCATSPVQNPQSSQALLESEWVRGWSE